MRTREYRQRNLLCTEYFFDSPLAPEGAETIEIYAREIVDASRASDDLPRLLFLQGGPGGKGFRPTSSSGWVGRALKDYRIVILDQRGTGLSSPANRQSLASLGSPAAQAEYLSHFRADGIVRDAEVLRRLLQGDKPWSTIGQSYGGWVTMTYLSFAPSGVRESFITGGLPPLTAPVDEVYSVTYDRTREKNAAFFKRHPSDRELCSRILEHLASNDVRLPTGERFSPRRFQSLGMRLGMKAAFDSLHYLLEEAFIGSSLSDTFLAGAGSLLSFASGPLYAVIHEPCCYGGPGIATRWSAERLLSAAPDFSADAMVDGSTPFQFTGEMIYPFMLDEDPSLVPLREAANLLAEKDDWPALYDTERLASNSVPVYAALYYEDQYVVREFSLETASKVANVHPWITNQYEHDGIGDPAVIDRLITMSKETA